MKKILSIISIILYMFILWYFLLPPLNIGSPIFWLYIYLIVIFICIVLFASGIKEIFNKKYYRIDKTMWPFKVIIICVGVFIGIILINFICSPLFNSKKYSSRINVDETSSFTEDIAPVDFNKIPLLDKVSNSKLGDRIMGQKSEWVSQFYVSNLYTQINYNDEIIRVTPIEYDGIIKYFTNRSKGIKGYITVNSVNGKAKLITLEKGMHYMPSALFFENLSRKLRISYPTAIFDTPNFEIDNNGNPYWIVPTIKYTGVGLKKEVNGIIILDAITGNSKKYNVEDIPSWVDHVYPADLIIEELDNWGEYKNGFLNSIFGQKNVVNTTDGYNYLVMDDDVYLYTGITSVVSDESNLGFVLVNLRTKETRYYSAPGAEEYSAMASAEGLVQEKSYVSTFPLLINLNNRPTYLLSLKDNAGLVKMYAFVDVEDYQKVSVSDASLGIENAVSKYLNDLGEQVNQEDAQTNDITISSITTAVIDGNTYYYITDELDKRYIASIKISKNILPFLEKNTTIKITYTKGAINNIIKIEE